MKESPRVQQPELRALHVLILVSAVSLHEKILETRITSSFPFNMARIARDSTPKRRSARLSHQRVSQTKNSKTIANISQSANKPNGSPAHLDAVLEGDEDQQVTASVDEVVSTTPSSKLHDRFAALSKNVTPQTEPKPARGQMHPATIHQTTTKAPDEGLKLGFADIPKPTSHSLASMQNTPTRPRQSLAQTNISPGFQFKFAHESNMTEEGRKMMETIRGDAARIKEQMRAEQATKDVNLDRRIAKPTSKSSRYSEIHMAQFKKMDSIANHPSSFRARPGFARPTTQSLKRSSSKADLDEPERPKTAGKSPSSRGPQILGRPTSQSPFKSIPQPTEGPTKRMRYDSDDDVTTSRTSTIPQPISSRLLSPTKASAARTGSAIKSNIPRSNSVRSIRSVRRTSTNANGSPMKTHINKPLPPTPTGSRHLDSGSTISDNPFSASKPQSRIPTAFANLKSILRSPKKTAVTPKKTTSIPVPTSTSKKVDFTPSVKSRYAVKLAENSPSPAKVDRTNRVSEKWEPALPYDSSAFVVKDNLTEWEDDEELPVTYPKLPVLDNRPVSRAGPVDHTFGRHARDHGRRESQQFKSIFTKCDPALAARVNSLTSVNTSVNRTNPIENASVVAATISVSKSPTIRHVRASEPSATLIQPFEDLPISTKSHGLPAKKRRMEAEHQSPNRYDHDFKENDRSSTVPGAWKDSTLDSDDEENKRAGKRARFDAPTESNLRFSSISPQKKPSAAREAAAKSAKDRKMKASIGRKLSTSRLNALAQPKQR